MVFSSFPSYNFDPSNWQQQQQNHQIIGISANTSTLPTPPPQAGQLPQPQPHGGSGAGSIRPGSMSERARMANIPMPETALKCPRCDSTNTKFCYFNNYSFTQPRHFCKTCRRYWTRGGALRSVPVGGGCRRNKRSKSTSSKSPVNTDKPTAASNSTTTTISPLTGSANILGLSQQLQPSFRFMSPLSQLTNNFSSNLGLNYSGISAPMMGTSEMNFNGASVNNFLGGGGVEPWRLQQFPLMDGMDPASVEGFYRFQNGGGGGESDVSKHMSTSSMLSQLGLVKSESENNNNEMNRSRQLLGMLLPQGNENHQWNDNNNANNANTGNWNTGVSNFNSSPTSN